MSGRNFKIVCSDNNDKCIMNNYKYLIDHLKFIESKVYFVGKDYE